MSFPSCTDPVSTPHNCHPITITFGLLRFINRPRFVIGCSCIGAKTNKYLTLPNCTWHYTELITKMSRQFLK